jgi:hypothetical protein
MAARLLTQARFTREQARFISTTPGLDDATKQSIRLAARSRSAVTLRARQHQELIRAVGGRVVELGGRADGHAAEAYRMLEAIIDALAPDSVRHPPKHSPDPRPYTEH